MITLSPWRLALATVLFPLMCVGAVLCSVLYFLMVRPYLWALGPDEPEPETSVWPLE